MEAATKNKRGRPADSSYKEAIRLDNLNKAYKPDVGIRTIQNSVNAEEFICLVINTDNDNLYDFFSAKEGQLRHKGIAEQIGRMMREGLISNEQAIQTADNAVKAHANGWPSKEIEKVLRHYRIQRKKYLRSKK